MEEEVEVLVDLIDVVSFLVVVLRCVDDLDDEMVFLVVEVV